MANSVESDVVSFDSALEKSLKRLCELGMSRELRTEQKDAISTLVSGKDLLAVTHWLWEKLNIYVKWG